MVTKQLMHKAITFTNKYIDNVNVITKVEKFKSYLTIYITIWSINSVGELVNCIMSRAVDIFGPDKFDGKIKYLEKEIKNGLKLLENERT